MKSGRDVTIYASLSLAAALILIVVSLAGPSGSTSLGTFERSVIALTFIACCAFGVAQSVRPKCHRARAEKRRTDRLGPDPGSARRLVGHHPDCERFDDHVVMLRGKCYCSGCLGLALGCCVAAVAMALLIFVEWPPESLGLPILLLGLAFVCLSLAETAVHLRLKAFHVLANIMLVIGFLAAVVGVAVGTQNGGYGLIAILLCLLWMDTRVQISNWKHAHVCHKCPQDCKSY